jgi:hypothetical protein
MAAGCRYDDAPAWNPNLCSGTFTPGAEALGDALIRIFGGSYQGYACRPNTADENRMSVHGTGRAVDYFPESKAKGDAAARWLTVNHVKFGVQLVIWWHQDWSCSALDNVPGVGAGDGWTPYGGPVPHTDHLHIELTIPASQNNTAATYTKELFTVGQYRELREAGARQTRMLSEKIVAQGRMTRDYIDARLDALEARGQKLSASEIAAIRQKVENESNEVMAHIDAQFPDPPIVDDPIEPGG